MGVENKNPFLQSFENVMPQLGFGNVRTVGLEVIKEPPVFSGIIIVVGIVGGVKGNAAYCVSEEHAKKIVSTMMMGMPVAEIDAMAKSALSELTNMLAANAATCFSHIGVTMDISTPTLLQGDNITIKMSTNQVVSLHVMADDIAMDINISLHN